MSFRFCGDLGLSIFSPLAMSLLIKFSLLNLVIIYINTRILTQVYSFLQMYF